MAAYHANEPATLAEKLSTINEAHDRNPSGSNRDEHVDNDVPAFASRRDGAEQRDPEHHQAQCFIAPRQPGVECVAHYNLRRSQDDHRRQNNEYQ